MGMLGNNANAQFDPRKFTWLGSSSSFANDAYILIVRTDIPVKTIDDARRPGGDPLVLGGTGVPDEVLSKTLTQLRPWSLMLVIASAEEYIADMLTALRA